MRVGLQVIFLIMCSPANAGTSVLELKLINAEQKALESSHKLKSVKAEHLVALSQAASSYSSLFPKLSFQGNYQYFAQIPQVQFTTALPPTPFGINHVFSVGPSISYPLWDTFSAQSSYQASNKSSEAKAEEVQNTQSQLLLSTRIAYIQVQLASEELRLIYDSLNLSRRQFKDVSNRAAAGAAAHLDLVTARRGVLNYEMQVQQRQTDLAVSLRELLNLIGETRYDKVLHAGPAGVEGVDLILKLDPFQQLIDQERPQEIQSPNESQPQIRARALESESLDLQASAQTSKLWPLLQLTGSVTYNQPNIPTAAGATPLQYWQESIAATLSMPLYLGDPLRKQAEAIRAQAIAVRERKDQLLSDLQSNFAKSRDLLKSLLEQRKLALVDVKQSQEAAHLYYVSYRAGRLNFVDVQNANLQALQAKVHATRIEAQMLIQIMQMKALSGKEPIHG